MVAFCTRNAAIYLVYYYETITIILFFVRVDVVLWK